MAFQRVFACAENVRIFRECKEDQSPIGIILLLTQHLCQSASPRGCNLPRTNTMNETMTATETEATTTAPAPVPTADMQTLMQQLGAAAPNTTITGSQVSTAD
jgi:hypothetical protein